MTNRNNPLPQADWKDRFEADLPAGGMTPIEAAKELLEHPPRWISLLMRLRNRVVSLLGLRPVEMKAGDFAGGFPILESSAERVVLGFDDRHLDFRIIVDLRDSQQGGQVLGVTTLVRRKNALGRIYLLLVEPFHRLIVPATMSRFCRDARPVAS